jgi:pyruvate kinase
MPIAGISPDPHVRGQLTIVWGVQPLAVPGGDGDAEAPFEQHAVEAALRAGMLSKGELVTLVSGAPGRRAGSTDHVRVVRA